jgi:DnaJ-class molecular chaperone
MPNPVPKPGEQAVECAFCSGTGKDPFGLLSDLSRCETCQGVGKNIVHVPFVRCGECHGTGAQPHKRLTCSACGGRGVQSVSKNNQACPVCKGTGVDPESEIDLSCSTCTGSGRVTLHSGSAS